MLSYEVTGQGVPVVLLHAFPLSGRMWQPQLKALQNKALFIVPDLPGFGKSARQKTPSIPEMAASVSELLEGLKIKEPVWVGGLSMGGYVAFEFFRQFPGKVRGLGLFSTRAAADTPEGREKRMKAIELIKNSGLEAFSKTVIPNLLGKTTLETRPEVTAEVKRLILENSAEGVSDALAAMAARRDSGDLLGRLQKPVMVAAGAEDLFIAMAESRRMSEQIPGAVFEAFPQEGHLINLENPEAFNAALLRLIQS